MKVFITGAAGFIGRHLVRVLLQKDWSIKVLLHSTPLPEDIQKSPLEIIWGDLSDRASLIQGMKDCQLGFHLASALGGKLISPQEFWKINVQGTLNFLQAAQKADIQQVIFFSSAGVLGRVKPGEVATEDYPPQPQTIYDRTKLEAEKIAQQYSQSGLKITIIRPGWVYGPEDRRTFKLFQAIARRRFILLGGGRAWQTPVYVDDLIQGTLLALEKGRGGEIFHLAGPEVLSVREMAEIIAHQLGHNLPPVSLPLTPLLPLAWLLDRIFRLFHGEAPLTPGKLAFFAHPKPLDISKAKRLLNYSPQINFAQGVEKTINWYYQHHWLSKKIDLFTRKQ